MSKHVIGLVLIDAPYSALNNAGSEASETADNRVVVKLLQKRKKDYPYVSGQAWRNWWRTTLDNEFNDWSVSPITRSEGKPQVVYTDASPAKYDDDDIFGYMRAPKGKGAEVVTRISPLKNSPLISIEPQHPTEDFGVMARHKGSPATHEHQFYSCILKGIFSLNLDAVGAFWNVNKTGYRNILDSYIPVIEEAGGQQAEENSPWILPQDIRLRRCRQTLEALPLLSGGAKLTSHLTDVTPKLIILSVLNGGNHPFMNVMVECDGQGELSIPALRQVISDYEGRFLDSIYIGRREGFMDELDESLRQLAEDGSVIYDSPNQVIAQLAGELSKHFGGE
ncbi:type I-B CRISPR-associated protein Cas7/Cst2/DevR [Candidatus Poribacteria bacterium]|nr:type I-B CRISPR-associated protein Cas7/Cst2/DevR [Candidatus Poribacteria bacterium]